VLWGQVVSVLSVTSAMDGAEPGNASFYSANPVAVTAPVRRFRMFDDAALCNPSSGFLVWQAKESLHRYGKLKLSLWACPP
jgi:hypothetical protein